jgi:hypothetical protein
MKARKIKDNIYWMGSVDWDRRLFDTLIPLPDGTSYNAYLILDEKVTLIDTVKHSLFEEMIERISQKVEIFTLLEERGFRPVKGGAGEIFREEGLAPPSRPLDGESPLGEENPDD